MIERLGSISCTELGVIRRSGYLRVGPATGVSGATAWNNVGSRPVAVAHTPESQTLQ